MEPLKLACLLLLLLCKVVHCQFYVDPSANATVGTTCTEDAPCGNIRAALQQAYSDGQQNCTIYLYPGVYSGPNNVGIYLDLSTTFTSVDSSQPAVLDFYPNQNNTFSFFLSAQSLEEFYFVFDNIVFTSLQGILYTNATDTVYKVFNVLNSGYTGGSRSIEFNSCSFNNFTVYSPSTFTLVDDMTQSTVIGINNITMDSLMSFNLSPRPMPYLSPIQGIALTNCSNVGVYPLPIISAMCTDTSGFTISDVYLSSTVHLASSVLSTSGCSTQLSNWNLSYPVFIGIPAVVVDVLSEVEDFTVIGTWYSPPESVRALIRVCSPFLQEDCVPGYEFQPSSQLFTDIEMSLQNIESDSVFNLPIIHATIDSRYKSVSMNGLSYTDSLFSDTPYPAFITIDTFAPTLSFSIKELVASGNSVENYYDDSVPYQLGSVLRFRNYLDNATIDFQITDSSFNSNQYTSLLIESIRVASNNTNSTETMYTTLNRLERTNYLVQADNSTSTGMIDVTIQSTNFTENSVGEAVVAFYIEYDSISVTFTDVKFSNNEVTDLDVQAGTSTMEVIPSVIYCYSGENANVTLNMNSTIDYNDNSVDLVALDGCKIECSSNTEDICDTEVYYVDDDDDDGLGTTAIIVLSVLAGLLVLLVVGTVVIYLIVFLREKRKKSNYETIVDES